MLDIIGYIMGLSNEASLCSGTHLEEILQFKIFKITSPPSKTVISNVKKIAIYIKAWTGPYTCRLSKELLLVMEFVSFGYKWSVECN